MYKLILNPYKKINMIDGRLTLGVNDLKGPISQPFLPPDISGLSRWYDFSDQSTITLSTSDFISAIDDKVPGSTHYMLQNTAAEQPHLIQNAIGGLSVGQFYWDGSVNDTMEDLAAPLSDYATNGFVFIVSKQNTSGYNMLVSLDGSNESSNRRFFIHCPYSDDNFYFDFGSQPTDRTNVYSSTPNDPVLITGFKDGANSVDTLRLNGGIATSNSSGFTQARVSTLKVGTKVANTYLAEVIIYNNRISDADMYRVEGYLAWKWGLQGNLPASHPYKNSAP
jgi:hypothetical protein